MSCRTCFGIFSRKQEDADNISMTAKEITACHFFDLFPLFVIVLTYYTYIMSNFARTVFYIGVTSNVHTRVWQHRNGEGGVFTSKYKCHYLMYYEEFTDIGQAIAREENLKNWQREWKINLIKSVNLEMEDLAKDWYG